MPTDEADVSFQDWCAALDRVAQSKGLKIRSADMNPLALEQSYMANETPAEYLIRLGQIPPPQNTTGSPRLHPDPTPTTKAGGWLVFATLLACSWVCFVTLPQSCSSKPSASRAAQEEKDQLRDKLLMAFTMGNEFVSKRLVSPGSMQTPVFSDSDVKAVWLGQNRYRVTSYVDSQNGYGALLRTHYTATLIDNGETWTCESLDMQDSR